MRSAGFTPPIIRNSDKSVNRNSDKSVNRNSDKNQGDHGRMEQIPVFESFGKRLEWWLDRRNVSRKDLMKFAGIAASTLAETRMGAEFAKDPSICSDFRLTT